MPIYEFECPEHGRQERLYSRMPENEQCTCLFWIEEEETFCSNICDIVWSLSNPRPDTMWSGVNTTRGFFSSQSAYNASKKADGIVDMASGELASYRKEVAGNRQSKIDKQNKELREAVIKECMTDEA